jgi:hydrogenase maturation protease
LPGDDPLIGAAAGGDAGSLDAGPRGPVDESGVLIVCYGNPLRGDDALGWHASELLATDPRLGGATVIWRHQLTPDLAADIKDASLVILVDVNVVDEPGVVSVRRVDAGGSDAGGSGAGSPEAAGSEPATASAGPSSHHVAPDELMALARELWGASPAVYVVSAGAETLEIGDGLSPAMEAALPAVVDAVASIVARRGGTDSTR